MTGRAAGVRAGRPRATSRAALERLGFELFDRQGFDATTVDDIAAAAGIGRRTYFRYFASKNDLVWGDFEEQLVRLEELLAANDPAVPMVDALRGAVVEFNRFDPAVVPWHRQRMALILRVPALQADSAVRYTSWRALVTEFAARRTGLAPSDLLPRLVGHAALAACVTAYEHWLTEETASLSDLLDQAVRQLAAGFDEPALAVLRGAGQGERPRSFSPRAAEYVRVLLLDLRAEAGSGWCATGAVQPLAGVHRPPTARKRSRAHAHATHR